MEPWLARAARIHPDRIALRAGAGDLTYAQLYAQATAVGAGLLERGVDAGEAVALALPSEELVVALHGVTGHAAAR
jgi:long-chain acyl-CoA synthetase